MRPPADAELDAGLAALRAVTRRLDKARQPGHADRVAAAGTAAAGERGPGQRAASPRQRRRGPAAAFSSADLLDELGPAQLIEIVDIDGDLHVLVCGTGGSGSSPRAAPPTPPGRPTSPGSPCAAWPAAGPATTRTARWPSWQRPAELQEALLGPAARHLGDGPVVIVPPGRLHAIPWALLPALRDRVVSVAPSASAWLRAQPTPPTGTATSSWPAGPAWAPTAPRCPLVARLYDDVTVLAGAEATAERVLAALDGAWLAHIAAHGSFRADSPLFSSLRMHDGPLTVYDFEQLRRAPYRLILSSCDSGVLAPAGADELLGLVSSLLPLGTAGIVAGVVPLNDQAVGAADAGPAPPPARGPDPRRGAARGPARAAGDPVQQATAASLVALGAA